MRKFTIILTVLIAITITTNAQIPNNGFENWTTIDSIENPLKWNNCNSVLSGPFYPVTKSTDHFPLSIGNYSIKIENKIPLVSCHSYGFAGTAKNEDPCKPAFPISGNPTKFCGYYKCFPLNGDTIQIGLMLFKAGKWIAGAELTTSNTVSNWTSFSIPISPYTDADSATITLAAFYNDTTCGFPYGPFGNSVLYVDNLSFDNLITAVSEANYKNQIFSLFPNPTSNYFNIQIDSKNNEDMTLNIYNVIGVLVKSETLNQNNQSIKIEDLSNGVYVVEISTKEGKGKQKLIIQR